MLHLVTAIIKPHRLETVKEALTAAGVSGMTISEVRGFGRQGGHTETYRGAEYQIDFIPKVKVEVVLGADDADRAAEVIAQAAHTGQIGDGKVWISPVEHLTRIRTGEKGTDAV